MEIERKVKYEAELDKNFLREIIELSHCEEIERCIQCGTCSSSCPMAVYMDYPPRKIMAMVKEGFKDEALRSFTIWLCSSCYTCTVRCPAQIKITDVMYALKRKAIEDGVYPARFSIPVLDKEMTKIIQSTGRNWEIGVVVKLYLKTNPFGLLKMAPIGLKLIKTGRMSFKKESIKNKKQLRKLLNLMKEETNA
ncbi:4Fe-4S dicluster domain-containing protein [Candidatus Aminicenantes bacterium AC-335-B20]|jgi:heterodisulfide reductase subunit C|nr:4Fe-4S dicluster domain-containing protein [SCandidatus Aminicenantes bacterium Aminicenantia_JdfR_composite]MCP2598955.1 4Fe-4S dicluster domain-containing protein [Candidatus Aminicenantes bacterium AC-335-B20]MCP2618339.1 4Fe-4S dicluster domain-containing protein [Candidatus Aminicenantes bacterium AC-335-A11]